MQIILATHAAVYQHSRGQASDTCLCGRAGRNEGMCCPVPPCAPPCQPVSKAAQREIPQLGCGPGAAEFQAVRLEIQFPLTCITESGRILFESLTLKTVMKCWREKPDPTKRREKSENKSYSHLVICGRHWSSCLLSGNNDDWVTQNWPLEDCSQLTYFHPSPSPQLLVDTRWRSICPFYPK